MPSSTGNDVGQQISHNRYSRILMVHLSSIMRWYTQDSARRGFAGNYKEIKRKIPLDHSWPVSFMIIQEISGYVLWILTVSIKINHSIDFANYLTLITIFIHDLDIHCPILSFSLRQLSTHFTAQATAQDDAAPGWPDKNPWGGSGDKVEGVQRSKPWLVSWVEGVLFYPIDVYIYIYRYF